MILEHLLQACAYLGYRETLSSLLPHRPARLLFLVALLVLAVGSVACP